MRPEIGVGLLNFVIMFKKMFFLGLLVLIFSCTEENFNEEQEVNSIKELTIDDYGKIHNESVLFLIELDGIEDRNKIKLLFNEMDSKYQNVFSDSRYKYLNETLSNNYYNLLNTSLNKNEDFMFSNLYNQLRSEALINGASQSLIDFYDDMYNNYIQMNNSGKLTSKKLLEYKNKLNDNEKLNIDIFYSIYNSSDKLWNYDAPYSYRIHNIQRACDPASQVILADAITGGLLSLLGGPAGPLGGGAASLLVRQQQIQNGGGCI